MKRTEAFLSRVKATLEGKRDRRRDRKQRQLFKGLLLTERIRSDESRQRIMLRPAVQKVSNQQRRKNEKTVVTYHESKKDTGTAV